MTTKKIVFEVTTEEYKVLKKFAKILIKTENSKLRIDNAIEIILHDRIDEGKIKKDVYYSTKDLMLLVGYIESKIEYLDKVNFNKILRKYGWYFNTKIGKWKIS